MKTKRDAINELSTVRTKNAVKRFYQNRVLLFCNNGTGSENQYDEDYSTHSAYFHSSVIDEI